jgi:hypothetical protein
MKHGSHNEIYRSRNNHKETTNHNNKIDNGVRQSRLRLHGPLSQWVRLSYFSSKLQKYIIKVKMAYKLIWLCSSRSQEPITTDDTENR